MIKVQNIYYMLSYVFQDLNYRGVGNFAAESFDYAADLYAAILCKGLASQLKCGISKEYVYQKEEINIPKGKICLAETFQNQMTQSNHIVCMVDEYLENTYLNQIIKAVGVLLVKSDAVRMDNKKKLKRVLIHFLNVDDIDVDRIDWKRPRYNKCNKSYKLLINICYLAIEGLLMKGEDGAFYIGKYLDNQKMHTLYEKFVLEYYRKHYPDPRLTIAQSYIKCNTDNAERDMLPAMKSDIMMGYFDKTLIIDTKYYEHSLQQSLFGKQTIHSSNMYQIYSYVKNKDTLHTGNVTGILLYAFDGETEINEYYKIDGNLIYVKSITLNCDFLTIQKQLDEIIMQWMNENDIYIAKAE